MLADTKGIFNFVLCTFDPWSVFWAVHMGVCDGSQMFGPEKESQCFCYLLVHLQTARTDESFNSVILMGFIKLWSTLQ